MTTKLRTLESMTPDIVHDISKSLLSVKVSRRWEKVQAQYILYAEKVTAPAFHLGSFELNLNDI